MKLLISLEKMFFDWYVSLFLGGGKVNKDENKNS